MKSLVEPGLVDAQAGVDHQPVAVEALDVIALVGGAVAPDVDAVLFHGAHQQGAGDGAPDGGGVEVGDAGGGDVEGSALEDGDTLGDQLAAAIDEPGLFGAALEGAARDGVVVGLIRLAEVGGVAEGDGALLAHPVDGGGGIEAAGKRDADLLAGGERLKDCAHG